MAKNINNQTRKTAKMNLCVLMISFVFAADALSLSPSEVTRRAWISQSVSKAASAFFIPATTAFIASPQTAIAADESSQQQTYDNPNIPAGPEERSGLIVLRVAEVAQFQEKIIRAVMNGDLEDVVITPQQIVFGTQILLRNSNLAGNMKLMIDTEIPKSKQKDASITAANAMNTLQNISRRAASVESAFGPIDLEEIADLYRLVRVELNALYEFLPSKEKDKYYGYFVAVTEYEKKIAEGVYNPELDGVLKFDYDK